MLASWKYKTQGLRRFSVPIFVFTDCGRLRKSYDYIIVGGGQSGLVVAGRLSEHEKSSVLVIEAGSYFPDDPYISRPWRPFNASQGLFHDPKTMWNITSVPQSGLGGRTAEVQGAATVGGGSTVNGMLFNRGSVADYDSWEELGNPGWGWKGILPYFRKSVTFHPPSEWLQDTFGTTYDEEAAYGEKGPIHASFPSWSWPGQKVQIAAFNELGIANTREGASGNAIGVFWVPRAQDPADETRSYAVTGYLDPAVKRGNLDLLPDHTVVKVLFSGVVPRGLRAKKEIILAANFQSPVILQRSGVGPKSLLDQAGIDVVVDLPGVGMNLQDHPITGLWFQYNKDFQLSPSNMGLGSVQDKMAEYSYESTRSGPYISGHNLLGLLPGPNFLSSTTKLRNAVNAQDALDYLPASYKGSPELLNSFLVQRSILERTINDTKSALLQSSLAGEAFTGLILQKPLSRGTVTLDPANPYLGDPLVDFGTLTNPLDVTVISEGIRFARSLFATRAMAQLEPQEMEPGPEKTSDEQLEDYVRRKAESSIGHECGTCAMMPLELGGVVGPDLIVHGTRKLSVVDSSIIPLIPGTNLCATVYAVAEKAADIIKKRNNIRL
ncbi:hypothetical protein BX600DRAFT_488607 [Xylariales sp. PMI_506]|nr:hypothetical protein BX600DRAFT_488607 [Xylariales sp. PMI_506]